MKQHRYTVKGTLSGSRCYEEYTEWVSPEELTVYMEEISALFTRDPGDELAQYIRDESPIHGVVTEIWVGVKDIDGTLYSWTEVTTKRELTEIEKDALLDYLAGQFSDGYGEGLEQQAFNSYIETVEEEDWDEETQEWYIYPHDIEVNIYLHLWQSEDFKLEFVIDPDLKRAVEEGLISEEELYEAQNITFNISNDDYGLFLSQIKKYVPIREIKSVSYFELEERGKYDYAYKVIDVNGNIRIFGWSRYGLDELKGLIKPKCKLIGEDGNIFNLIGIAARSLRKAGLADKATEMSEKVMQSKSYTEALSVIMEYVEVE